MIFHFDNVKIHGQVMVMTSHFKENSLVLIQINCEHLMFLYRKWDNFLSFFKSWLTLGIADYFSYK